MIDEELKKVKAERPALTCEEAAEFIKQHCCPYYPDKVDGTRWETVMHMAIEALKERGNMVHGMSKFCRHIDMGDKPYTDAEAYEFWKNKMKQQFGWR